jgi:hypothetical protein
VLIFFAVAIFVVLGLTVLLMAIFFPFKLNNKTLKNGFRKASLWVLKFQDYPHKLIKTKVLFSSIKLEVEQVQFMEKF